MITCTGASLGYGIAQTNPYIQTLLQGARIPRTNQLPVIPPDKSNPTISCGPGTK
jgi:hypothetical protein